jgi:hypothetical protein
METTTLSYDNMHEHGALFPNMLRARHRTFIEAKNWDCPKNRGWSSTSTTPPRAAGAACTTNGRVMAGVRLTPTTADAASTPTWCAMRSAGCWTRFPGNLCGTPRPIAPHIWDAGPGRWPTGCARAAVDVIGQAHLLGPEGSLRVMLDAGALSVADLLGAAGGGQDHHRAAAGR